MVNNWYSVWIADGSNFSLVTDVMGVIWLAASFQANSVVRLVVSLSPVIPFNAT